MAAWFLARMFKHCDIIPIIPYSARRLRVFVLNARRVLRATLCALRARALFLLRARALPFTFFTVPLPLFSDITFQPGRARRPALPLYTIRLRNILIRAHLLTLVQLPTFTAPCMYMPTRPYVYVRAQAFWDMAAPPRAFTIIQLLHICSYCNVLPYSLYAHALFGAIHCSPSLLPRQFLCTSPCRFAPSSTYTTCHPSSCLYFLPLCFPPPFTFGICGICAFPSDIPATQPHTLLILPTTFFPFPFCYFAFLPS